MAFSTESAVITDAPDDPADDPAGTASLENALLSLVVASTESQLSFGLLRPPGLLGVHPALGSPPTGSTPVELDPEGKPNLSLLDTGMGFMGSIGAGTSKTCSSLVSQS